MVSHLDAAMANNFYVDLFSNSSLEYFPDNTVSNFTVKLSQPIQLDGEYECALAQLICPQTSTIDTTGEIIIVTFPESYEQMKYGTLQHDIFPFNNVDIRKSSHVPDPSEELPTMDPYVTKTKVVSTEAYAFKHVIPEKKVFTSAEDVLQYLNDLFSASASADADATFLQVVKQRQMPSLDSTYQSPITFYADPYTKELRVMLRDYDFSILLSGSLARILGFGVAESQYVYFKYPGVYKFPSQRVDLNAARPSIMSIYTNIVLPLRVSDSTAPLLRVCTVPSIKAGDTRTGFLSFEFDTLHYIPIALKYIQDIEVEVRGPKGDLFPFNVGLLYLRLHFRKQ